MPKINFIVFLPTQFVILYGGLGVGKIRLRSNITPLINAVPVDTDHRCRYFQVLSSRRRLHILTSDNHRPHSSGSGQ